MSTSRFFDQQHTTEHLPLPWHFRMLRRWERPPAESVARLLQPGDSLLDIGCGDGSLVRRVAERFQKVVALDVSPATLEVAARLMANHPERTRVRWQQVDVNEGLPFPDASFSAITCVSLLQYVFDPEALLAEIHRVLTPMGQFVVEVPNMVYLPQRLRVLAGKPIRTSYYPHGIDGGNLHYYTLGTLAALLQRAGFHIVRKAGSGVFAPCRRWWLTLLSGDLILVAQKTTATAPQPAVCLPKTSPVYRV